MKIKDEQSKWCHIKTDNGDDDDEEEEDQKDDGYDVNTDDDDTNYDWIEDYVVEDDLDGICGSI